MCRCCWGRGVILLTGGHRLRVNVDGGRVAVLSGRCSHVRRHGEFYESVIVEMTLGSLRCTMSSNLIRTVGDSEGRSTAAIVVDDSIRAS